MDAYGLELDEILDKTMDIVAPSPPLFDSEYEARYSICEDVARSGYSRTRLRYSPRRLAVPSMVEAPGQGVPSA